MTDVRYAIGLPTGEEGTLNCITLLVGRVEKMLRTVAIGLLFVQDVTLAFTIGCQNMENYQGVRFSWRRLKKMVRWTWKN
jgi:hypothetical protein